MITATNKGCLQKPKSQTRHKNPFYMPHSIIRAAHRQEENSLNIGDKIFWESAKKLTAFVITEESEIDRKYQRLSKIA